MRFILVILVCCCPVLSARINGEPRLSPKQVSDLLQYASFRLRLADGSFIYQGADSRLKTIVDDEQAMQRQWLNLTKAVTIMCGLGVSFCMLNLFSYRLYSGQQESRIQK